MRDGKMYTRRDMTVGQIPTSAIDRWVDRHGYDDEDETASFRGAIRAMDRVYRQWVNREPGETGTPGAPAPNVSSRPLSPALFDAIVTPNMKQERAAKGTA